MLPKRCANGSAAALTTPAACAHMVVIFDQLLQYCVGSSSAEQTRTPCLWQALGRSLASTPGPSCRDSFCSWATVYGCEP